LQPIPPSADWQFHIAEGCPRIASIAIWRQSVRSAGRARLCQPAADIAELASYEKDEPTSFEVSCYTDPLGIEHLTGSLAECIRYFGTRERGFCATFPSSMQSMGLLDLPHNGQTRCRASINAAPVSQRLEGGTASVAARFERFAQTGLAHRAWRRLSDWSCHRAHHADGELARALHTTAR
jgi:spore photoproduct lyase